MNPHTDAILPVQQEIIGQLGPLARIWHMYLGGGTAVALHLGHRRSVDLDWFSQQPISDPMQLAQQLQDAGIAFQTNSVDRGTLHGTIRGVRVSLLEYRYPLLKRLDGWPERDCPIAATIDLAAMKLLAVAQRGTKKDFVDVYALGVEGLTLREMLQAFLRKFSVDDTARVIYSLSYFDDAEPEPMPQMLWEITWDSVKHTINEWIRDLARSGNFEGKD